MSNLSNSQLKEVSNPHPDSLLQDVRMDVVQMSAADAFHSSTSIKQFQKIIENEARAFGVDFNRQNFENLIVAIKAKKAGVYLMSASCRADEPHFIGAIVLFPSVITIWNGEAFDHHAAQYFEDLCISSSLLTNFIRTTGARFSQGSKIGVQLIKEVIISSSDNDRDKQTGLARALIAEYSPESKLAFDTLNAFNLTTGSVSDSGVFEFASSLNDVEIPVRVQSFLSPEGYCVWHNAFVTEWSSNDRYQHIVATFTEGISSFSGSPIVRVQIMTNGNYPSEARLKSVVRSLIAAGCNEIQNRGWFSNQQSVSMRIHVLKEARIRSALVEIGAVSRMLGKHLMMPMLIHFSRIPSETLKIDLVVAKPLRLTEA